MPVTSRLGDRRPTYLIDTPCFTRQYIVRPPAEIDPIASNNGHSDAEEAERRRARVMEDINAYLDRISAPKHDRFVSKEDKDAWPSDRSPEDGRPGTRMESLFTEFKRDGVPIELIIDIHSEYFCLNFRAYPAVKPPANDEERALVDLLRTLSVHAELEGAPADLDSDTENDKQLHLIYDGAWAEWLGGEESPARFFARPPSTPAAAAENTPARGHAYDVLAIFKGFVLRHAKDENQFNTHSSLMTENAALLDYRRKSIVPEEFLDGEPLVMHSSADVDERRPEKQRYSRFVNAQKQVARFSPFYTRILGLRLGAGKRDDYHGGNAVLCGFLDGLAVYGSNFDPPARTRNSENSATVAEVRYFVLYNGPSRNQLARLIRHIHYCGENRIFALIDSEDVRDASQELNRIAQRIERRTDDERKEFGSLIELRRQTSAQALKTRAGLKQRVLRSRYHWTSLQERLKSLRTQRVFGWQTYDEYITRTFGPQVDTYLSVGETLDDIESRLAEAEEIVNVSISRELQLIAIPFLLIPIIEVLDFIYEASTNGDMGHRWIIGELFEDYRPLFDGVSSVVVLFVFVAVFGLFSWAAWRWGLRGRKWLARRR